MEFDWSPDDAAHRRELRAFLDETLPEDWEELAKHGPGSDTQAAFSKRFCAALAERGWLTQHWPAAFGGSDASAWRHSIVGEELWAIGEPRGPQYMNVNWIGPAIMRFGTRGAEGIPPAEDLGAARCSGARGSRSPRPARIWRRFGPRRCRDGDDYVVNGTKIWTSYVNHADFCIAAGAHRSRESSRAIVGISVLLVPMDTAGHRGAGDSFRGGRPLLPRGLLRRRPGAPSLVALGAGERRLVGGDATRSSTSGWARPATHAPRYTLDQPGRGGFASAGLLDEPRVGGEARSKPGPSCEAARLLNVPGHRPARAHGTAALAGHPDRASRGDVWPTSWIGELALEPSTAPRPSRTVRSPTPTSDSR